MEATSSPSAYTRYRSTGALTGDAQRRNAVSSVVLLAVMLIVGPAGTAIPSWVRAARCTAPKLSVTSSLDACKVLSAPAGRCQEAFRWLAAPAVRSRSQHQVGLGVPGPQLRLEQGDALHARATARDRVPGHRALVEPQLHPRVVGDEPCRRGSSGWR